MNDFQNEAILIDDFHCAQDILLLVQMAALWHDVGKACDQFQNRLKPTSKKTSTIYRHEWISLRIFQAFVCFDFDLNHQNNQNNLNHQNKHLNLDLDLNSKSNFHLDSDIIWLERLSQIENLNDFDFMQFIQKDGLSPKNKQWNETPFETLPFLAQAIGWLILTHHRLPVHPNIKSFNIKNFPQFFDRIEVNWNQKVSSENDKIKSIEDYWKFGKGLSITNSKEWQKRASKIALRLKERFLQNQNKNQNYFDDNSSDNQQNDIKSNQNNKNNLKDYQNNPNHLINNVYVMHVARLCLMWADHHYSSLHGESNERMKGLFQKKLFANTHEGKLNQLLDEHLIGVEAFGARVVHALPLLERHLPRLIHHKTLKKHSENARFHWQNKAFELAASLRDSAQQNGAFLVNMASTGCGKTLANARIMFALSDQKLGMRCSFAMGLRTLTLQTGSAFQKMLELNENELAIRVGGSASRELFEFYQNQVEKTGSESRQKLLETDEEIAEGYVQFEGHLQTHSVLEDLLSNKPQFRSLLLAPILVCTVDHLTPATESQRAGHQIAPMLRLMSSDLVLDEPDDFDLKDLPALTRLLHWAGLLGSRVLLSSATLPPALIEGLFSAYAKGRRIYQRNRGLNSNSNLPIVCAWFDENKTFAHLCDDLSDFKNAHQTFIEKRFAWLSQEMVRRRAEIIAFEGFKSNEANKSANQTAKTKNRAIFAQTVLNAAHRLHDGHHSIDPQTKKRVSFGLIRMANVEPLIEVALELYKIGANSNTHIHLCVYHSKFPLLFRSEIERHLDAILDRRNENAVFDLESVRSCLDANPTENHIFIVLGSPVTEVGRDHDYDWAIVEPSSMRSLIQLAGRVCRHRLKICPENSPNILITNFNLRHFEHPNEAAFCKPGFQKQKSDLAFHSLQDLLEENQYKTIDARARIQKRFSDEMLFSMGLPIKNWVDLEHIQLERAISGKPNKSENVLCAQTCHETNQAFLTAVLPQIQPFREETSQTEDFVLLPTSNEIDEENQHWNFYRVDFKRASSSDSLDVFVLDDERFRPFISDNDVKGEGISPWIKTDYMQTLSQLANHLSIDLKTAAKRFSRVQLNKNENGWRFHPTLGFVKRKKQ